jgi:cell division protein FtsL
VTRVNLILFVSLLVSSIYLVRVSYDARRLFAELDKAQTEERTLDSEHERLKADLRTRATPLRIEKTARERLAMRNATPAVTQYVTWSPPASAPTPGARR